MTKRKLLPGRLEQVIDTLLRRKQEPAVVVVDVQEGLRDLYSDENGPYPFFSRVVERQAELVYHARKRDLSIILVENSPRSDFGEILPELECLLRGYAKRRRMSKRSSSAFYHTRIRKYLQKNQPLLVMGFHPKDCVLSTAEDAFQRGHKVISSPSVLLPPYGLQDLPLFYFEHCDFYDDTLRRRR